MANITRIRTNQISDGNVTAAKIASKTLTGSLFAPDLSLNSNVTILGNLNVTGNSSVINSVNTYIQDPIVVFNNGYTGSLSGYDIGILVNRNFAALGPYGAVNTAWVWVENDQAFEAIATTTTGNAISSLATTGYANIKVGNISGSSLSVSGTISASNFSGGFTATMATVQNFSSGNAVISGGYITGLSNVQATNASFTTLVSTNLSTGNAVISGGYITGLSNVQATNISGTTGVVTNFSSGNIVATTLSATTEVATNLSTGNILVTGGTVNGLTTLGATTGVVTNFSSGNISATSVGASTLVATNFSSGNVVLTGGASASTLVATNFSSANVLLTGGNANGLTTLQATTAQATNLSSGNVLLTGGSVTGLTNLNATNSSATTLVATNFSSSNLVATSGSVGTLVATTGFSTGNASITNLGTTTSVATNFSSGNAVISGGSANGLTTLGATTGVVTNFSTANAQITSGSATTLVATNLSSGNVVLTGGYAQGLANIRATEGQFTNLSTGNALITGGAVNGLTTLSATTAVATNLSTGNALVTGGAVNGLTTLGATTGVVTNFSSGNAQLTNFSGTTGVVTNFSSGNAVITNLGSTTGVFTNLSSGNITGTFNGTVAGTVATANVSMYDSVTALTNNQTFYPKFSNLATSGNSITGVSSAFTMNPSTGTFGATAFSGTSASITNIGATTAVSTNLSTSNLVATSGSVGTLVATTGFSTGNAVITNLGSTTLVATNFSSGNAQITGGTISGDVSISATTGQFTNLSSGNVQLNGADNNGIQYTSGVLQITGGAGISGNLYVQGNIYAGNLISTTTQILEITEPLLYLSASNPNTYNYEVGFYSHFGPAGGLPYQHTGLVRDHNDNVWKLFSNVAEPAGGTVSFTNAIYETLKTGAITLANTTVSSSTTTGALVVAGGTGIAGALNVGGTSIFSASVPTTGTATGALQVTNGGAYISGNLWVGGNINFTPGSVNTIQGNSGSFFGNASGFGALYTGISSGYVVQPQTIIQSSANFNGYAQINHQNINSGASASTDFVATADAGNATAGFIDMGINSSGFVGGAGNELNYPLDGYLYTNGTAGVNGNLILGTNSTADIVFTTGGFSTTNNYQGRFKNNVGLILAQTTTATNTTSGALQVAGGAGIAGALYAGSIVNTPVSGSTGYFTTAQATNFSTANALVTSLSTTTSVATNFSSGNAVISGGSANGLTTLGATTGVVTNFSTANAVITSGSATTLVATNLSSGNVVLTGGASASTLVATNLSSGNVVLTGGYATSLANLQATNISGTTGVVTNFSTANAVITSGSATTLVATNFSSGNAVISGAGTYIGSTGTPIANIYATLGTITNLIGTNFSSTTAQATNFSSGNAQLTNFSGTTGVVTNFSSGNAMITGGTLTGISLENITTLQATNFSSPNVLITGGYISSVANVQSPVAGFGTTTTTTINATTGNITNIGTSNIVATTGSVGTLVATTGFSTPNAVITSESVTTGVTTNFSTGNARITGGYADNFAIGANTSATGSFTTLKAGGVSTFAGNLVLTSSVDTTTTTTGALVITGTGGAAIASNVYVGNNLYIGASALSQTFANPTIIAVNSGANYTQMALKNTTATGSADYAAYGDTGTDASGWADMGFTGSTFNDGNYTITKPNDGYFLVKPTSNTYGGNLILSTSEFGSYNDVVIGVGAFHANAEVARFHGNTSNSGYLNLAYTTNASPAANTGALRVQGGASFASNVYHGGATILNGSKTAGYDTIVKGKTDESLIWARPNATYDTVIVGGSATASTVVNGAKLNINSSDSLMLPVGTNAQRPGSAGYTDVAGMLRFSTTGGSIEWYNGTSWQTASTSFTVIIDNQFNGDGGTVTFTTTQAGTTSASIVSINGIVQIPTLAYSLSGTTLTFTEAPAVGDIIDIRLLTTTTTVTSLSSATGKAQILVDDATGIIFDSGTGALPVFQMPIGGGMVTLDAGISVATANTPTTIDTVPNASYRTAKYIVQVTNGSNYQSAEALVIQNGTTATITTYGVVQTAGNLGVLSATVSGGNTLVQFIAANATNTVKVFRQYVPV
jgi:hypothetical protein